MSRRDILKNTDKEGISPEVASMLRGFHCSQFTIFVKMGVLVLHFVSL